MQSTYHMILKLNINEYNSNIVHLMLKKNNQPINEPIMFCSIYPLDINAPDVPFWDSDCIYIYDVSHDIASSEKWCQCLD